MPESIAGRFLVATPRIVGAPFVRAVVLMLEHDDTGAIGIILNAPTDIPVVDHLPGITERVSEPPVVFVGGPVSTDTAILLGRSATATFLTPTGLGDVGIVDIEHLPADLDELRVFAGYSGWSPGQLEAELLEGSWWVLPPRLHPVFSRDVDGMWEHVVGSAPGTIPFYRTFPDNIRSN